MSLEDATHELNRIKYDWKKDRRHFKVRGIIPWNRCVHCASMLDCESLQYCRRCHTLLMFQEAFSHAHNASVSGMIVA